MTKMQNSQNEIEIKHPLHNPQHVMLRLQELGATLIANSEFQEDTYYVPAHRNFLDESIVSEWLRIRRTLHTATINYKRWLPIGAEIQTHCDEYESAVANAGALEQILQALDMREIVKVSKKRSIWRLKDVEVAIDQVDELGFFIELEFKGHSDDIDLAISNLRTTLGKLEADVSDQDRRGYPYRLLNREK